MDYEQIKNDLKARLKASRYLHCVGVEEVSHDLAVIYNYPEEKAVLAGILHDCAKYLSEQELLTQCKENNLPVSDTESRSLFLLHAKVGAVFARNRYGINDNEILDAITYHTTGRPAMSLLEKIVFVADYIEPNRRPLPGLSEIRYAAYTNLDQAVYMTTDQVLKYLNNSGREIDRLTADTYSYYKNICGL